MWRNTLRKYLAGGVAIAVAAALGGTAVAQAPDASSTVSVSPSKAGKKKKPKNETLNLTVTNNNEQRSASALDIKSPKTITVSGKGFPKCSQATLEGNGKDACPKGSKVGSGSASALLGVNGGTPQPLTFDVTAYAAGAKRINFYLEGVELPALKLVAPGTIKGRNLHVDIPEAAQQPIPGTWAGLKSLTTKLGAKKGKHYVVASTGCAGKKHKFTTTITFVDNGVQPAGKVKTSAAAKCKK
jgi:hypothetical protein